MTLFSKKMFLTVCLAVLAPLSLCAEIEYQVEDQPVALERALTLDNCGVLRQKR